MLHQHNKITKTTCYSDGIKLFGSTLKLNSTQIGSTQRMMKMYLELKWLQ